MNNIQFQGLVIDVGKILLFHIDHLSKYDDLLITYSEVAQRLPYEFNPRNLDHPLGMLSDYCMELGLPLISTIVVNQDTYMPGSGYFKYYFQGVKKDEWPTIFIEQYNRVKECTDWLPLYKELGLK